MPEKIEKDGVEIDVFTAEEVAAREAAAVDAIKAEHATVLATKEAELKKVSYDLSKLGEKDHNFSVLRSQKEELEKQIKESGEQANIKIEEVRNSLIKDVVDEMVVNFAGGDEELKKKIEFHYNRLPEKPTIKAEISKKMAEAYLLATGSTVKPDPLNRALPTGGGRMPNINSTPLTPEQVELGKKMGVTEEDIKKHGGKK